MENISHTLVGLMMSRAGLTLRGEKGAAAAMMIAANAPDLDLLWSGLPGGTAYLEYHRGITHSLLFIPVMAAASLAIGRLLFKSSLTLRNLAAAALAVASHLLLDLTNVYGIRLALPFSSHWYRLDITDVIDPIILGILLFSVAAPAMAGLITSEIGAKSGNLGRTWAMFALIAVGGYDFARFVAHTRALAMLESHVYGGTASPTFTVVPAKLGFLHWRGIVEGDEYVLNIPVDITRNVYPSDGHVDYPTRSSPAIESAKTTSVFQTFLRFGPVAFWRISPSGDEIRVELIDLRFGTPWAPGFAAAMALVDPGGSVHEAHLGLGR